MLQDALLAYNAYGAPAPELLPSFTAQLTKNWVLPSNSPVILNQLRWDERKEARLNRFFEKLRKKHQFVHDRPYFAVNRAQFPKLGNFPVELAARGWQESDSSFQMCIWEKPWKVELKKGFRYTVGRYDDKRLVADAVQVMAGAFDADPGFFKKVNKTLQPYLDVTALTVIYSSTGRPAAAGAVGLNGTHAFLFSGSVAREYQGLGLWRNLIAIRQSVKTDVRTWVMTTKNPRIRSKADHAIEFTVFEKSSLNA